MKPFSQSTALVLLTALLLFGGALQAFAGGTGAGPGAGYYENVYTNATGNPPSATIPNGSSVTLTWGSSSTYTDYASSNNAVIGSGSYTASSAVCSANDAALDTIINGRPAGSAIISPSYGIDTAGGKEFRICCQVPGTPGYTFNGCESSVITVTPSPPPAPTVTVTVSSNSVLSGAAVFVTWSSTNATSCTSAQIATGNATSGSVQSNPVSNTTYTVTCTGPTAPNGSDSKTVTVTQPITGTCAPTPSSANTGVSITWNTSSVSGGSGTYTYSWSGDEALSGSSASATKAGGYATPGSKNAQVVISSSPATPATITCSSATINGPDLTAGDVSIVAPTSVVKGAAAYLRATVTNGGNASTGSTFSDLFEIDNDNVHALFSDIFAKVATTSVVLASSGSNIASTTYTFATAGTWYVRACADTNASNVGAITESNEGNNCSSPTGWSAITVQDICYGGGCSPSGTGSPTGPGVGSSCLYGVGQPSSNPFQCCTTTSGICPAVPALPTVLLSPATSNILLGDSASLTWASNASVVSCTGSPTNFAGGAANNAVGVSVSPGVSTSYSITCPDAWGNNGVSSAQVNVVDASLSISASKNLVRKCDTVNVTWSATGGAVTSCTVTGPAGVLSAAKVGSANNQTINNETTYRLSCSAGALSPVKTTTVKLAPQGQEL